MPTRNPLRAVTLAAVVAVVAGCGKSLPGETKSPSGGTPDPTLTSQLTQTVEAAEYQLSVPADFTPMPSGKAAGNLKVAAWKGKQRGGDPPTLISVVIFPGEQAVADARKNMRQLLVNFSAGVTDTAGIQITKREGTETATYDGLAFSRFRWSGTVTATQTAVRGRVYGAIDGRQVITIIAEGFGASAEPDDKLMEAAIATFKKK